jgi:hypothetical protein
MNKLLDDIRQRADSSPDVRYLLTLLDQWRDLVIKAVPSLPNPVRADVQTKIAALESRDK